MIRFKREILPGITLTETWDPETKPLRWCESIGCLAAPSANMGRLWIAGRWRNVCITHISDITARFVR